VHSQARRAIPLIISLAWILSFRSVEPPVAHANTNCSTPCSLMRVMSFDGATQGSIAPVIRRATGTLDSWDPFIDEDSQSTVGVEIVIKESDPALIIGLNWTRHDDESDPVLTERCSWCSPEFQSRGPLAPGTSVDWSWEMEPSTRSWTLFLNGNAVRSVIVPAGPATAGAKFYDVFGQVVGSDTTELGIAAQRNLSYAITGMTQCGGLGEPACTGPWVPRNTNPWLLLQTAANLYFSVYWPNGNNQLMTNCHRLNTCS